MCNGSLVINSALDFGQL